jgi:hypothetical protein
LRYEWAPSSAYGRYLTSTNASDVSVSTPGRLPGVPAARLVALISGLPGITSSAAFLGMNGEPIFHGHIDDAYSTNGLDGSFGSQHAGGEFFRQDRMTVLAGRQAIRPQAIALTIFGIFAALAMIVLVGQCASQLLSMSANDIPVAGALGATRAQTALAVSLPGVIAVIGSTGLAVAGAVALSPLAPVGPVRRFDPVRGVQADGLVLGAGAALLAVILLGLLAIMAARAGVCPLHRRQVRRRSWRRSGGRGRRPRAGRRMDLPGDQHGARPSAFRR